MSIIAVTGHRPNKLFGWNMNDCRYVELKSMMKGFLVANKCTEAVTGMALGVDQLFAEAVIELKREGYPIKLHCAIPCQNHSIKWPDASKKKYAEILAEADEITLVTDGPYNSWVMEKRNRYMVDISDEVLAVYTGEPGGTRNCIKYATEKGKKVTVIDPFVI